MKFVNTKNYINSILIFFLFIFFSAGCSTENNVTTVVPAAPTNLTANLISTTQVNLTWTDNATNETGYKVQRKITGGNFADIASVGSDITTYNDLGLSINTTYIYRIYSYNSAGNSPLYSNEVTIATISIPIINTNPVDSITAYTVICGGNVSSDNGSAVTLRGVCWSTSSAPDISLPTKTNDGSGIGNFRSQISGLIPNTSYYIRAYATNSLGTAYGNEFNFNTPNAPGLPTIITSSIGAITSTTATSGGNISNDGGSQVTSRGVCWSTSSGPTTSLSTKTNDGSGVGLFGSNLTSLSPYTTYYVRSYATNSVGTAYGNELSFTTLDIPSLTTSSITNILSNSAMSGGNIANDGGSPVTSRGVCWSTFPSPNISLSTKTIDGSGVGNFSSSVTSLNPNTTYYVRAYATNSIGTAYGNEVSFTTISLPTITTTSVLSITAYTASSGGNISNDGGSAVISRGVCWSISPNPDVTLSTKTIDGTGVGTFLSSITGLTANTTYYVRAYATNSVGTSYGAQQTFTTVIANVLPSVTIGTQVWTSQNLDVARYRNGDVIPQVTDNAQWSTLSTGAWCWYDNDSASYAATYGRLYNWYAVNDARGLAPAGWHVPSNNEWYALQTTLVNLSVAVGGAMKSTSGWYQDGNGTNSSGFTGLPGACRFDNGGFIFMGIGQVGYWWSSSNPVLELSVRSLNFNSTGLNNQRFDKRHGFSVRCVRD